MPIPKAKRSTVVMEFMDNYERKKVYGRVLSEWSGDPTEPDVLVYESHRTRSQHFHRLMDGWNISAEIFNKLREMEVQTIRIISRPCEDSPHENEIWCTSMSGAIKFGTQYQLADYEPQWSIPQHIFYDPRETWW